MACRVIYYRQPSGRVPMIEFLDDLTSVKHRAAILADIDLLASEGPILPFPLTSAIAAHRGLRELRTRFAGAQFRMIYTIVDGDPVVLHAFQKTSSAQLSREYAVAAERARSVRWIHRMNINSLVS